VKTFARMTQERLGELVSRFPRLRVAVLGDFFLDKYLDVDESIAETSVETGKTAHQVVAVRHSPGAAGTVVSNLAALGTGTLYAIGFTGDDGESYELRKDLRALGCSTEHLHLSGGVMTPVYLKPRYIHDKRLAGEHNRYDTKNRAKTSERLEKDIVSSLDALLGRVDAVILADQVEADDCGVVTSAVRAAAGDRAKHNPRVVFCADSRSHIDRFRNVVTKPNQFEAVGKAWPRPDEKVPLDMLLPAITRLRDAVGAPVCATRGADAMIVTDPEPTAVRAVRVDGETDTTGAGDSVTAGVVLALAAGATLPEAALIGNLVASITIQQLATTGVARPDELPPRLQMWLEQSDVPRGPKRRKGK